MTILDLYQRLKNDEDLQLRVWGVAFMLPVWIYLIYALVVYIQCLNSFARSC